MGSDGCDVTGRADLSWLERLLERHQSSRNEKSLWIEMPPMGSASLSSIGSHPCGAMGRGEKGVVEEGLDHFAMGGLHLGCGGTPRLDLRMGTNLKDADVGPHGAPTPSPTSGGGVPSLGLRWRNCPCQKAAPVGIWGWRPGLALGGLLAGFAIVCHQGGSATPYLCVTLGCLSVYGCHIPATMLGTHQHPRRGNQRDAGG